MFDEGGNSYSLCTQHTGFAVMSNVLFFYGYPVLTGFSFFIEFMCSFHKSSALIVLFFFLKIDEQCEEQCGERNQHCPD